MFFKYCPQCGSMQIKSNGSSLQECMKCRYVGEMKEGTMDQVNAFVFNLKNSRNSETLMFQSRKQTNNSNNGNGNSNHLKDRLRKLDLKDVEIL